MCEDPEITGGGSWYCTRALTLLPHATGPQSVLSQCMLTSQLWNKLKTKSIVILACECMCPTVFNVCVFRTSSYLPKVFVEMALPSFSLEGH